MNSRISTIVLFLFVLLANSCKNETSTKIESESIEIDLVKVKGLLQELDDQFGKSFSNMDSVTKAEHYAKEGTWGSVKGKDNLASARGKWIRYANKEGTPNMKFIISSVSSHGKFVVETGVFELSDLTNIVKTTGEYLVVRKLEDDKWKMYRDIGL
jgi:hypothetical protein